MNKWNQVGKPIVVLAAICIIITGALALTNAKTRPMIDSATRAAQERARQELLPEADSFTAVEVSVDHVDSVYLADNGTGAVVTSHSKGYGGTMTVMAAFGMEGTLLRIQVTESSETQGIGSKVARDASFWTRFEGLEAHRLTLGQDVDGMSGATISSKALLAAVNAAIDGYHAATGR